MRSTTAVYILRLVNQLRGITTLTGPEYVRGYGTLLAVLDHKKEWREQIVLPLPPLPLDLDYAFPCVSNNCQTLSKFNSSYYICALKV